MQGGYQPQRGREHSRASRGGRSEGFGRGSFRPGRCGLIAWEHVSPCITLCSLACLGSLHDGACPAASVAARRCAAVTRPRAVRRQYRSPPHGPGGIPQFDHACDFVIVIHGQKIDIVGMGFFVSRRHWATGSRMFGMIRRKENGCPRRFIIGSRVKVIGGTWCGNRR